MLDRLQQPWTRDLLAIRVAEWRSARAGIDTARNKKPPVPQPIRVAESLIRKYGKKFDPITIAMLIEEVDRRGEAVA